jgi:hypothetical protein
MLQRKERRNSVFRASLYIFYLWSLIIFSPFSWKGLGSSYFFKWLIERSEVFNRETRNKRKYFKYSVPVTGECWRIGMSSQTPIIHSDAARYMSKRRLTLMRGHEECILQPVLNIEQGGKFRRFKENFFTTSYFLYFCSPATCFHFSIFRLPFYFCIQLL